MLKLSIQNRTILQCGLAAVTSVLLMSWLRIRPLGVFLLTLLGFWLYRTRCNFRIVPPPELQNKYVQLKNHITCLRLQRPTMFCACASGCLLVLAIIGHLISGSTVVLVGLMLAALLSTKYNFKLVKIDPKDFAWSDKLNYNENEFDDEFMPDVTESNLFVLERASDMATISSPTEIGDDDDDDEEKSDEIPSELLIPDVIPEIDENSSDDDDNDDLVPEASLHKFHGSQQQQHQQQLLPLSTQASSMEFRQGHFKRDSSLSSTSSEESLSKGLQFPDHTAIACPSLRQLMERDGDGLQTRIQGVHNQEASDIVALAVKTQAQAFIAQSSKLLPSLVSGLVQWSTNSDCGGSSSRDDTSKAMKHMQHRMVTALDSSDDSDFEILETDDFK